LAPLEVHDPVAALVAAAAVKGGDAAVIVATARLAQAFGQRLLRLALVQLGPVDDDELTLARRDWIEGLQRHRPTLRSSRRWYGPLAGSPSLSWCRNAGRHGRGTASSCRADAAC